MKTERIVDGDLVLAIILRDGDWEEGLNFITSSKDYLQVGFWGYHKNKRLASHIHLIAQREIMRTQELLFIKEGRIKVDIYNEEKEFFKSIELREGDTIVLFSGGHGYEILEDCTKVLEVKNGPYVGEDRDRKRI